MATSACWIANFVSIEGEEYILDKTSHRINLHDVFAICVIKYIN